MQVTPLDQMTQAVQAAVADGRGYAMCPACGGGSQRRLTLGLTYKDAVVFGKCFRASCLGQYMTVTDPSAKWDRKKQKEARVYDKPTIPLQGEPKHMLIVDYGIDVLTADHHGWRLTEHGTELVMPILDHNGLTRGHVTRTLYEEPKRCFTYKATFQSFIDWWYSPINSAPVVVVEDTLSACRLSGLGYNAVALLGTNISQDDAREIRRVAGDRVIYLALDRDAFDKAVKYSKRHRHIFGAVRVVCLEEDIKNMQDDDDIRELFDGRTTDTSGDNAEQKSL